MALVALAQMAQQRHSAFLPCWPLIGRAPRLLGIGTGVS
jgi:hypothetical protein